jgi:hypothetical protein
MQRWATTWDQIKTTGECKPFAINGRDGHSVSSANDSWLESSSERGHCTKLVAGVGSENPSYPLAETRRCLSHFNIGGSLKSKSRYGFPNAKSETEGPAYWWCTWQVWEKIYHINNKLLCRWKWELTISKLSLTQGPTFHASSKQNSVAKPEKTDQEKFNWIMESASMVPREN